MKTNVKMCFHESHGSHSFLREQSKEFRDVVALSIRHPIFRPERNVSTQPRIGLVLLCYLRLQEQLARHSPTFAIHVRVCGTPYFPHATVHVCATHPTKSLTGKRALGLGRNMRNGSGTFFIRSFIRTFTRFV